MTTQPMESATEVSAPPVFRMSLSLALKTK
jgi:hypothetical protein